MDIPTQFPIFFDNVLKPEHLEEVRSSALKAGFGNWEPTTSEIVRTGDKVASAKSQKFKGVGFQGNHAIPMMALTWLLGGHPLYPGSMLFRINDETADLAYIHSDRSDGDYTAILYLSDEKDERSGTGFYHYNPNEFFSSGLHEMPCYRTLASTHAGDKLKADMLASDPEKWTQTAFVQGKLNRMVVFHGPLFHSRLPREGLGANPETARMVWVCHFQTKTV